MDPTGEYIESGFDIAFITYDLSRIYTDNIAGNKCNLGENLAALGLDVVRLALPGATGLGLALRGAKGARVAKNLDLDALSRAGSVLDLADSGGKLTKAGRALAKHGALLNRAKQRLTGD